MNIVLFAYMVPEVVYIHKHCLTKSHKCSVLASIIMGFCISLTSNLADLDKQGWQCSHVTGLIFLSACLPFSFPYPFSPFCTHYCGLSARPALVDKSQWVMTVEVDMPKWSEQDYVASEINHLLVISILKMLSLTDAPRGDTLSQGVLFYAIKKKLLYVPHSLYLLHTVWRKKIVWKCLP